MRTAIFVFIALALASCGVDGEPFYPQASTQIGVSNNGAYVGTRLASRQGPLSVSLGVGL
jgi:hypothetical protein